MGCSHHKMSATDPLMRSLPALRHGKNVMKIHFLWILFWLYACEVAQSQTCMIRVLKVEGDKTVDSPLLLDGSKDVLVSIGRGITIQGTAINPVSDPAGRYDTAKELSVAFGSDEATARTRRPRHSVWTSSVFAAARRRGDRVKRREFITLLGRRPDRRDLPAHVPRPTQAVRGHAGGLAEAHSLSGRSLPDSGAHLSSLPHGGRRRFL